MDSALNKSEVENEEDEVLIRSRKSSFPKQCCSFSIFEY